jgi:hypothetical protein
MTDIKAAPTDLRINKIFKYWLPLALSWMLMSFENPFVNGAMARLSEAERMIAAFGVVYAVSLVIESPVISLLPTATALARSRQSYETIRRFTIHLILISTALHFLIAWSGLFDLVIVRVMNTPQDLIEPVRLGLKLMVLWSAAIAWRRFNQGILIRNGEARYIGQGTVLRMVGSAGMAALLAIFTRIPGVAVGTIALSTGVIAEGVFAHLVARATIHRVFYAAEPRNVEPLSYIELVKFQIPLALSNLLYLGTSPLITMALARGENPIADLAAWPVVSSLLFLLRAPGVALPEAVIALHTGKVAEKPLGRFSLGVGAGLTALLALVSLTPLADLYFSTVIGLPPDLTKIAIPATRAAFLLPVATALLYYYRGVLTALKMTVPITLGMLLELLTMGGVLIGGIALRFSGVSVAAAALTTGFSLDAVLLWVFMKTKSGGRIDEVYDVDHS